MSRIGRRSLSLIAAAVLVATPVIAQETAGTIVGTVQDSSGAVLPGVSVSLTGEKVMGVRTTVTDGRGSYQLRAVPPGIVELSFELPGFTTVKRTQVRVELGAVAQENVSMKVGAVAESITVEASAGVVDTQTSKLDTTYDKEWFDKAPLQRRSFIDVLASAPGIDPNSGNRAGNVQLTSFGSMADQNKYQIDGIDTTDNFNGSPTTLVQPNTDVFEAAEILSLGAPAEYGNVQGAVFNLVTRSGTNVPHGSAAYYSQTNRLTGANTTSAEDDGFPFTRVLYRDVSAQLGGPISKDKVWMFGAYRRLEDSSVIQIAPQFANTSTIDDFFFKPTVSLTAKHRIDATLSYQRETTVDGLQPNQAPITQYGLAQRVLAPLAAYNGVLSNTTVVEVRFAGFYTHVTGGSANPPGSRQFGLRMIDRDTGFESGAIHGWYDYHADRTTVNGKVSHHASDFLGSAHDFKFGLQYNESPMTGTYGVNNFIFTYSINGALQGYGYQYSPYKYGGTARTVGGFVDDAASVGDRLTLNLGVRYDHTHTLASPEPALDTKANPTSVTFPQIDYYTWNTVSPRLGFNLKLTSDGKTVLKGHYGRYYPGGSPGAFAQTVPSVSPTYFGTYNFATQSFENVVLAFDNSNLGFDANQKPPKTDQFIVDVERELGDKLNFSAAYIHKRTRDLPGWLDTTGLYVPVQYTDAFGTGATGNTFTVYQLSSIKSSRFFLFTTPPGTKSDADALSLTLTKRMSKNWQLTSSAVFTHSTGDRIQGLSATQNWRTFGQNPNDYVNSKGLLPQDRAYVLKTQFLYTGLPAGLSMGVNYYLANGYPIERRVRIPLTGVIIGQGGGHGQPALAQPRTGSMRFPDINELDLRVEDLIHIRGSARLRLAVDLFNAFNNNAYQAYLSKVATDPTYGQPSGSNVILPFRAMLSAKFDF